MMYYRNCLLVLLLLLSGCQAAFLTFPGGRLSGPEVHASSFSFASEFELLQLEVRPSRPYSVWLRVEMYNDILYIDAAASRRWHGYMKDDSRVRIKLGDKVYPATATPVTDAGLLRHFLKGRTIYRLDPR
jgi:hypothetical protein